MQRAQTKRHEALLSIFSSNFSFRMKTNRHPFFPALVCALIVSCSLNAQQSPSSDSTGLPGDHFSLEGAIEMFKKAESLEAFEKALNTQDNAVNNLDLNEDGETDYIRVVDKMDGTLHAIVLQAPVSADESQDIAVIEIEKTGEEEAILQILGDPDIFGDQVIMEPFEEEEAKKDDRNGPFMQPAYFRVVVNVWFWPGVRFLYAPAYIPYVSPWRWRVYPAWYRPWRPYPWRVFHVRVAPFRPRYHVVGVHRVHRAHAVYVPHRRHSRVVHTRTTTTYRRAGVKRSTTTTTVRGRNGNVVKRQKTTTTRARRRH